ncbi:paraquat-inducible protein A [Endozoicomonas sp. SCSIO W0465]|uniref:paraquat-inducible protein A n=1 Tax=Endozoicomonas sp. SCSIO W0465 TaxID=2918516 RepID=UPI002075E035|nr:paraquat-inducible protein A [Endozoicomonas sp. SCSIO W0465]USE36969.1 paraquat-inducible protein A [Endozoicomonas sp. SCSIO W0465]
MVSRVPDLLENQVASCPRCANSLVIRIKGSHRKVFALGLAALILQGVSCFFPFMAIDVEGISQQVALIDVLIVFFYFNKAALASLLLLTIIFLPAFYLMGLMTLFAMARNSAASPTYPGDSPWVKRLFRFVFCIERWLLVDIFFIGALISIIKMASLSDISIGKAFWTYFVFALLVVKCSRTADRYWLCTCLFAPVSTANVQPGDSHLTGNHLVCFLCNQINPATDKNLDTLTYCQRCHFRLFPYNPGKSIQLTTAVLMTSMIFYFPANLYPMMYTTSFGDTDGSTIMDGVLLLWKLGSYPVALVILTASIILPMTKMLILVHLLCSQRRREEVSFQVVLERLKLYRFIEVIGRWSMIDVFVVAILTALVQFGELMRVTPGRAVFYFALVVIFTLLSTCLLITNSYLVLSFLTDKTGHASTFS